MRPPPPSIVLVLALGGCVARASPPIEPASAPVSEVSPDVHEAQTAQLAEALATDIGEAIGRYVPSFDPSRDRRPLANDAVGWHLAVERNGAVLVSARCIVDLDFIPSHGGRAIGPLRLFIAIGEEFSHGDDLFADIEVIIARHRDTSRP